MKGLYCQAATIIIDATAEVSDWLLSLCLSPYGDFNKGVKGGETASR